MSTIRINFQRPGGNAIYSKRAFTAVEVTAVATIIAMLALILIPILRGRVEEAKITAAMDDMNSIEKAETLAFADTGKYFRLQDLARPKPDLSDAAMTPAQRETEMMKLPKGTWNRVVLGSERAMMQSSWKGPYYSIHRSVPISDLIANFGNLIRPIGAINGGSNGLGGPILVFPDTEPFTYDTTTLQGDDEDWDAQGAGDDALKKRRYPTDPWGNPYIFFGAGKMGTDFNDALADLHDISHSNAAIYCLGPDGLPGGDTTPAPANYFRPSNQAGDPSTLMAPESDDMAREF